MNIAEELKPYILQNWDIDDDKQVRSLLSKSPVEEVLDKQLHELDCTRIGKVSGLRLQQTIGYPYSHQITITLRIISTLDEDSQLIWMNKLLNRHKLNLAYEETNPPIWYSKKHWTNKATSKRSTKRTRVVKPKIDKTKQKLTGAIVQYSAPLKINPKLKIKI